MGSAIRILVAGMALCLMTTRALDDMREQAVREAYARHDKIASDARLDSLYAWSNGMQHSRKLMSQAKDLIGAGHDSEAVVFLKEAKMGLRLLQPTSDLTKDMVQHRADLIAMIDTTLQQIAK